MLNYMHEWFPLLSFALIAAAGFALASYLAGPSSSTTHTGREIGMTMGALMSHDWPAVRIWRPDAIRRIRASHAQYHSQAAVPSDDILKPKPSVHETRSAFRETSFT